MFSFIINRTVSKNSIIEWIGGIWGAGIGGVGSFMQQNIKSQHFQCLTILFRQFINVSGEKYMNLIAQFALPSAANDLAKDIVRSTYRQIGHEWGI